MSHYHHQNGTTFGRQYIALFVILLINSSCNNKTEEIHSDFLSIKITNSSGDDFSFHSDETIQYFAPFPFNVAILGTEETKKEIMLISKRLDKGSKVDILPIAKLTISDHNQLDREVFIAIPLEEKHKIIDSKSFTDFTVEQFSLKQIVEYWYSNRYGLNGTSIKGWSPAGMDDLN